MADPVTLLAIGSLVAGIAGTAVSTMGAIKQGQAQSSAADYQSQVAKQNQRLATQKAQWAAAAGNADLEQQGLKQRAAMGAIRAGQAASGVDINTGSALDVQSSAAELGELNALTINSNTARQVYGYRVEGVNYGGEAQMLEAQSKQAAAGGYLSGFGSLLGGASAVGSQYVGWTGVGGPFAPSSSTAAIAG